MIQRGEIMNIVFDNNIPIYIQVLEYIKIYIISGVFKCGEKLPSVREFATLAFHHAGIEIEWQGSGIEEKGINKANGKVIVEVSPDFYRPTDVVNLWGDPTKAKTELGWNPMKTSFEELVALMTAHDMEKVAVERAEEHIKVNLEEYLEKGVVK